MPKDLSLPPPLAPGYRKDDSTYWCNCVSRCNGIMTEMPRRTYTSHGIHRRQPAIHPALPPPSAAPSVGGSGASANARALLNAAPAVHTANAGAEPEDNDDTWMDLPVPGFDDDDDMHMFDPLAPLPPSPLLEDEQPYPPAPEPQAEVEEQGPEVPEVDPDDPVPVVTLDDLKLSLAFIERIKTATLAGSGLSANTIARLQSPMKSLLDLSDDEDTRLCIDLFVTLTNTSQKSYNKAMEHLRRRFPNSTFLSYDACRKKIEELTGVIALFHDMCINSCMAFTGPLEILECCRYCGEPRKHMVKRKLESREQFYTIPVGPQLQALTRSIETAKLIKYRRDATAELLEPYIDENGDYDISNLEIPVIEDYIQGSDYINRVVTGDIKERDLVLMLSIDGAQLYESKASDCWIYIWVLMDLPPSMRYKKKFVMPGGFIPGPNKPKDVDSFLFPGIHHLAALQNVGLGIWDPLTDVVYITNPFFIFGTADGPGLVYLHGRNGHNGYIGCRLYCEILGRRYAEKSTKYYPVLFKPRDHVLPGSDHPDVDIAQLLAVTPEQQLQRYETHLRHLLESPNMSQYKIRRRDTGISRPSMFSGLNPSCRLNIIGLFPSDIMHLTALNVTDIISSLLRGTLDCGHGDDIATWDWAVLTGDELGMSFNYAPPSTSPPVSTEPLTAPGLLMLTQATANGTPQPVHPIPQVATEYAQPALAVATANGQSGQADASGSPPARSPPAEPITPMYTPPTGVIALPAVQAQPQFTPIPISVNTTKTIAIDPALFGLPAPIPAALLTPAPSTSSTPAVPPAPAPKRRGRRPKAAQDGSVVLKPGRAPQKPTTARALCSVTYYQKNKGATAEDFALYWDSLTPEQIALWETLLAQRQAQKQAQEALLTGAL